MVKPGKTMTKNKGWQCCSNVKDDRKIIMLLKMNPTIIIKVIILKILDNKLLLLLPEEALFQFKNKYRKNIISVYFISLLVIKKHFPQK